MLALFLAAALVVEPPPGWEDVTASRKGPNVAASLKGPETSSFVLTRIRSVPLENRAVVRGLLLDVLAQMESRMKLGLRATSNLVSMTFANDLTAHLIRAEGKGKEKLILAVTKVQDETLLVTLVSAVPDTILPSLMNGIKTGPRAPASSLSADGQLDFSSSPVAPRPLTARERKAGFVAALAGAGTEVLVMRLSDDGTPIKDQPDLVKQTVLAIPGVKAGTLSPLRRQPTTAGPEAVYAAAKLEGGGAFAAGYLPWAYWGYSVLSKGPEAEAALSAALAAVAAGADADPRLVAATPRVPGGGGVPRWVVLLAGAAFAASVAAWYRKRNTLT